MCHCLKHMASVSGYLTPFHLVSAQSLLWTRCSSYRPPYTLYLTHLDLLTCLYLS